MIYTMLLSSQKVFVKYLSECIRILANDTGITAESERELQILTNRVNKKAKHFRMKMNIKKKTMVISKKVES